MRLGIGDAFVGQPAVQILQRLEAQPRREEALAHQPDPVLDLTLLPACCRRAGLRLDKVVSAHLQEAAVVPPVLADRRPRPPPSSYHRRCPACRRRGRRRTPDHARQHHLLALARIQPARRTCGCGKAACAPTSRSPSPRPAGRSRGSSRTGRLHPAQNSAGYRPRPPLDRVPSRKLARAATPNCSCRHSRDRASPRISGSASAAPAAVSPHSPTTGDPVRRARLRSGYG